MYRPWRHTIHGETETPLTSIIFGEVRAGEQGMKQAYLRNEEENPVRNLIYNTRTPSLKVVGPRRLEAKSTGIITLVWSPDFSSEEPLDDLLEINGDIVFGAELSE